MEWLFLGQGYAVILIAFVLAVLFALPGFRMAIVTALLVTVGVKFLWCGRGSYARHIAGFKQSSWRNTVKYPSNMGGQPTLDAVEER